MNPQNDKPLISIITPTLNSEKFIRDNITSILDQTYPNIEHIIVDGGSKDKTLSIVADLDPNAVVISEPDKGISDAFNKGIGMASGNIIAILNSDDYYAHNRVVQKIVEIFDAYTHIKIIYGRVRCVQAESGKTIAIYGEPFSLGKMKKEIITPHPAIFARAEVYETVGSFSLEYRVCMDYEYFLRATSLFEPYFVNEILAIMRWGGLSTKNIYLGHREAYKILRSNGINIISAFVNLAYRYTMSSFSLALQRVGLDRLVLLYRKQKGRL